MFVIKFNGNTYRGQELAVQIEKALRSDRNVEFRHLFHQFLFRTVQTIIISAPKYKLFDIFSKL